MTTTTTMTKTARLHAAWVRLAALLALLVVLGVLTPYARAQTTSITFFHNDVLGSPAVATDASGAVVWKESYLPYGHRLQAPAAGANNKLWYAGKQLDPNTGLSYMGARYYSPVVGRFMGIDPVEFQEDNVHSFNRYAYANNNPYKYVDPDGRHPLLVFAAVGLFMLDFHHAATSNEPFTGVGGSVAPAGAKLAGVFARSAASEGGVAAKGGSGYIDGYRAVSKAEADDIAKHGFRPHPEGRSMGDKWFSETRQGAEQFQRTYPELQEVVKTKVPRDVYNRSYKHPNIDNTGPGFCIQCTDLGLLPKP
ncbi:RHS repeat domain-containing protein [Acidovorax sp. Q11]